MRDPSDAATDHAQPPRSRPRELAMSAAWNAGAARAVTTTDGQPVTVIFPGHWTHGFGPDFADAMLDFGKDGFQTGAVEIHTRASDWIAHGHHVDERYNTVILHIVTIDDLPETRRADGRIVPVAILSVADDVLFAIDRNLPEIWADLGGDVCAAELSRAEPARIRTALQRLGDTRLQGKVTAIEGHLADTAPDDLFLELLFDGFGYSENRGPMRQLAATILRFGIPDRLSGTIADAPPPDLIGLLLGIGGFLPFSPTEAHMGGILPEDQYRIERAWLASPAAFAEETIPATAWHTGRVRPANHPVARIMQAAALLARTGGRPLPAMLDAIRNDESPGERLREWTTRPGHPGIGAGRATAIVASIVIPFALAWAAQNDDPDLEDAALRAWHGLKLAEWTRPARRAMRQVSGGPAIRSLGERGHQGLLHLDRMLCTPRRCYECPIAAEVVRSRSGDLLA